MPGFVRLAQVGVALLTAAGIGAVAVPAQAASTGIARVKGGDEVHYIAGSNLTNKVVVTRSGRVVTIDDRVPIRAGAGCKAVKGDRTKVRCTVRNKSVSGKTVVVQLGNKNDSFINRTPFSSIGYGGSGSDSLTGGRGADHFRGESGKDKLVGAGGRDLLYGNGGDDRLSGGDERDSVHGGNGNDVMTGNNGPDLLNGGPGDDNQYGGAGDDDFWTWGSGTDGADLYLGGSGRDKIQYIARTQPIRVDLDGAKGDDGAAGEHDTVGADIEDIRGGSGDDILVGNGSANRLDGVLGNDRIFGGDGRDQLLGDSGNDYLSGEDPTGDVPDVLDGSIGTDVCRVFPADVATGCEG
ncbi:calcium-binding protein [Actinoplanes aureus]|uniref:Calcium-binding protein n=1 Tax=Actinoplanes aureus TaxID=2792083 RepID=A0A931C3W5_9ACTN|nr:calcium-binding protein [Actinoplanes aureus]MBG0560912.1 calcium-binding protein [Actinoplanes aureus]